MTEPFDPSDLVALARAQRHPALAEALARCIRGTRESCAYVRFADPYDASWAVGQTVRLGRRGGDVLVDVLTDGRVGGVEWLSAI